MPFTLFVDLCPVACFNFLALAASSYYDGCAFHRSVAGFVLQGGDPSGTGKGCDTVFADRRYYDDEGIGETTHAHRGSLCTSTRGAKPNANASQFFVCYAPQPQLDGNGTVFGQMDVEGEATLARIEALPVDEKHRPLSTVAITEIIVQSNPFAAKMLPPPLPIAVPPPAAAS